MKNNCHSQISKIDRDRDISGTNLSHGEFLTANISPRPPLNPRDPKQPEEIALAIKSLVEDSLLRQSLIEKGLIRANQWTATDYLNQVFSVIDDFEAIRRCWQ